eukprot:CAMPEP_0198127122 /NCGR_PEP_ID=MMETSP1442-20131203/46480_1 /TAXON_ID= /ORGANISM="Craspedostauros australis, Strain CCMP3328" /LENGTH=309 /DNA_ID=CAMNT_0043787047 /DNA_START=224 /DNA_END=1153 /DNA_ORIENTATION=-
MWTTTTAMAMMALCVLSIACAPSAVSAMRPPKSMNLFVQRMMRHWNEASEIATLEQEVEDYNAQWVANAETQAQSFTRRRLICMPLDDRFNPSMGHFSHNHVQTGDKMSLPMLFWRAVTLNGAEVPWLFSVKRVDAEEGGSIRVGISQRVADVPKDMAASALDEVVGGILDFRAPANYVFLPWWMMRALGLRPRDVVDVELVTKTPPGSLALLRPHSSKFAKTIDNPQAVLETELRHYSSLTQGSTIAFDYNGERYWFDVAELRSGVRGEKKPIVKVQDCDLSTNFLPSKEEVLKRKLMRQKAMEEAQE